MPLPPQIPKVSVLMLTYNHEPFIAQAIESALIQETNFGFEIVIGEDCSTDKTREIVREFQSKHPDKIRLLPADRNLGMHRNYFRTLRACAGEYVAVLEGDDFWTSPGKLQKQADFLDSHSDYVICFHNVLVFRDDGSEAPWLFCSPWQKKTSTIEDLLLTNFVPTRSVMFRNGAGNDPPDWTGGLKMLDWPLFILHAQHGLVGYLNETMAAYRVHAGGRYSTLSATEKLTSFLRMYESLSRELGLSHEKLIKAGIFRTSYSLAVAYAKDNDIENAAKYRQMCLRQRPFSSHFTTKMKLVLRWGVPRLFSLAQELKSLGRNAVDNVRSLVSRNKPESIERRAGLETTPMLSAKRQA